MVMDQKANSIADLAAVLNGQDRIGAKTEEEQTILSHQEREAEVREMLRLADQAKQGGIDKLNAEIVALQSRRQAKKEGKSDEEVSNRSLTRSIHALEKQKRKMLFAANAVAEADRGVTAQPNGGLPATQTDDWIHAHLESLRQQIRGRRQAELILASEAATPGDQASGELASEEAMADTLEGAIHPKTFTHGQRELVLELEMIRRLHGRPERIEKALDAYTARQRDVERLRGLAQHWEHMLDRAFRRYERRLDFERSFQEAVDGGEAAFTEWMTSNNLQLHDDTFERNQKQSPLRKARMEVLEKGVSFLRGFMPLMSERCTVEEMKDKIEEVKDMQPSHRPDFILQPPERGRHSQLKVMGPDRAYATALAKVKIEAHATELARQLEDGAFIENGGEEVVEEDEEATGEQQEAAGEGLAPPTTEELRTAVKQVRRLTARIADIDNIEAYQRAVDELSRGESLSHELKPIWAKLGGKDKLKRYTEYLDELSYSRVPLQLARKTIAETDSEELLSKAAESARERSVAARSTGENKVALEQKFAAKLYERVGSLREYEDVVLRAPRREPQNPTQEEMQNEGEEETVASQDEAMTAQTEEAASMQQGERASASKGEAPAPVAPAVDYAAVLPSFPGKETLPKKGAVRNKLLLLRRPIFTAAGVTVRWNDMLDAEYAETWPENVEHVPMGLSRHTAPRAGAEPIFDVAEFKNQPDGGYKGKRWAREVEDKEVRNRVKGVTEEVFEAVVAREREERRRRAEEIRRKEGEESRLREQRADAGDSAFTAEGEVTGAVEKPVQL